MARTIAVIYNQMTADYVTSAAAAGITINPAQWSMFNLQRLLFYTVAAAIGIFEQLQDAYYTALETSIAAAPSGHPLWVQEQVYAFQYNSTNPQIVQLNTDTQAFYYPTVDASLRIVTRCSVTTDPLNRVTIKVAKGDTPIALTTDEVSALQGYMGVIGFAGIDYAVSSTNSDKLYLQADVQYLGQYSSIILANVTAAINGYLAAIPFNGILRLSDLQGAMKGAAGVIDVVFKNVSARADGTSFGSGTSLVLNNTELQPTWSTKAGYIVGETTSGSTFADTLNLIPQ